MEPTRLHKFMAAANPSRGTRALRALLQVASGFYGTAVRGRNLLYDKGWLKPHKPKVPVISVGNITVGGTGKTPLVVWLCQYLKSKQAACGILTRGYRCRKGVLTDEPAILAKSCPQARVVVNRNRRAGAAKAIEQFGAQILILDDGFQHRDLARDLDIVTVDATCPFGYGQLLPAGLLREPLTALRRADVVVITRADLVEAEQIARLQERLQQLNPKLVVAQALHKPTCAKAVRGHKISLEELRGKQIFAFCGVGNPESFVLTLQRLQLNVVGSQAYADHHCYTAEDVTGIFEQARYLGADIILTTQKDWVKTALPEMDREAIHFAYLDMKLEFVVGEDKITHLLDRLLSAASDQSHSGPRTARDLVSG